MDLEDSVFNVLLLMSITFFLAFHLFFFKKKNKSTNSLAPGKSGWPVIRESLHFVYNFWKGHPEDYYITRMNKYSSKAFRTHIFGGPMVVLCGPKGHILVPEREQVLKSVVATRTRQNLRARRSKKHSRRDEIIKENPSHPPAQVSQGST